MEITRKVLNNPKRFLGKNSVKKRGYTTVIDSHAAPREKTVTKTEIFVTFEEERQQSLHYSNYGKEYPHKDLKGSPA